MQLNLDRNFLVLLGIILAVVLWYHRPWEQTHCWLVLAPGNIQTKVCAKVVFAPAPPPPPQAAPAPRPPGPPTAAEEAAANASE